MTYHPIPEHLDNIRTLRSQVDQVIVIDNASNADEVEGLRSLQAELALVLVENHENMGIGYALNQGVRWALEHDYKWINTFDQDSCVTEGYMRAMIEDFEQLATEMPLGLLVPRYRDPLTGEFRRFRTEGHLGPFVTITSGSLFPADVIRTCGPFVEELFMYGIDDEYSLRLRQRGARDVDMKEIADLAELTFELHDRVLSLVDGRERIHHLLLIVRHTLLDLVDGLERRNNVGVHQRLHLGQRRQDRSHVDAELPIRARRENG